MFHVDGGNVHVVPDPDWEKDLDQRLIPRLNRVMDAVYRDVVRLVPEDTTALRRSARKVPARVRPVARVKVGGPGLEYWADQEYGTGPHTIESHGRWPLCNRETGEVFGRVVNHPGNEAQPYLRPALYRRRPF